MPPKGHPAHSSCGMSLVWPKLWVGNARSVNFDLLMTHDICILIWATPEVSPPSIPDSVNMIQVLVKDEADVDMSSYFPIVTEAFKNLKENTGMMVVCRAGVSRSATLALAALVGNTEKTGLTLKDAYKKVKIGRPFIRPNHGFFSQLIQYEIQVLGTSTVEMLPSPYDASEKVPSVYLDELKQISGQVFSTYIQL